MSDIDYRQENLYKSQTLVGNWFEDRSNHKNLGHKFDTERRNDVVDNFTLTRQDFNKTNDNWLKFQTVAADETYKTIYK